MLHFICELILSCVVAGPGVKTVDELTYGNVLYGYYQQDYQQALLDTMVAEAQDRRGENPARHKHGRDRDQREKMQDKPGQDHIQIS